MRERASGPVLDPGIEWEPVGVFRDRLRGRGGNELAGHPPHAVRVGGVVVSRHAGVLGIATDIDHLGQGSGLGWG